MCLPAAVGAVLGVASSAAGAVGQYQAGQAANANSVASYEHALQEREHSWRNELSTWAHRRLEYKKELQTNDEAANRGYVAEQTRLNEAYQAAAFQGQDQLVALMQKQGLNGERQGVGAGRLNQSDLAAFGRGNATIAANLSSARNAAVMRQEDIRRQMQGANNKAFSQVALKPIAGIAPPKPQLSDPTMGLVAGLAGAAASGIGAFSSLQAPQAFTGTSNLPGANPANFQPGLSISGINYGGVPSYSMPGGGLGANFNSSYNFLT